MQTISSSTNSLILWERNTNRSGIGISTLGGDRLFLKPFFLEVFQTIASKLKTQSYTKFVDKVWMPTIYAVEAKLRYALRDVVMSLDPKQSFQEDIERVVYKFQGNLGEIFAEKFFTSGLGSDTCKPESYSPVDPCHEEGVDASGISPISNLKIGIQIKNYSKDNKVGLEEFRTAGDESDKYVHTLSSSQFEDFLRCPCQCIFSFTEAISIVKEQYESRVKFLGPSYIESKGLCGRPGDKCGNWTFFQDIADEISNLSC